MKPEMPQSLLFHFRNGKQIEAEYSSVEIGQNTKTAAVFLDQAGYRHAA